MRMTDYRTLGRSGLIVSPLALGTMTFGAGRWGSDETEARAIFDTYVEAGGNLFDTADVYSGGESEAMLGRFLKGSGMRDRLVISTKSGFPRSQGHPMHGGNGAFNIRQGSKARCAASAPTGSISTGCMSGTGPPRPRRCCGPSPTP